MHQIFLLPIDSNRLVGSPRKGSPTKKAKKPGKYIENSYSINYQVLVKSLERKWALSLNWLSDPALLNWDYVQNKTEDPSVQYAGKGYVLRRPKEALDTLSSPKEPWIILSSKKTK